MNFFHILFYIIIGFFILIFFFQLFLSIPRLNRTKYTGEPDFKTLVVLPCKGTDYNQRQNFRSLCNQEYERYKIVAVVDSDEDPAIDSLKSENIEYLISSNNTKGSGKVKAITTAIRKNRDYDAYIIADSDIYVGSKWLKKMLQPLLDDSYGISTTFPYFSPVDGFWSKFKTAWGFVGNSMMQSKMTVFGWGGSLAFRNSLVNDEDLNWFDTNISDDMALTEICKRNNKKIAYVEDAEVTIFSPDNWKIFREWSLRQTTLLLSNKKRAYSLGVLIYGSSSLLIAGSTILSIFISPLFSVLFLPLLLNEIKMYRRLKEKKFVFIFIQILLPFFYVWNLWKGNKQEKIVWRGITYDLYKN